VAPIFNWPRTFALGTIAVVFIAHALSGASVDDTLALGRKALRNDGMSTAWQLTQRALTEAPDSAGAHELAGEILFRRGEFSRAGEEFSRASKLDAHLALAWWGLARVAECTSLYKTADQYFRRAHELDPGDSRIFADWAVRVRGPQHIPALEQYASMLDSNKEADELEGVRQHIQLDKVLDGRKFMVLDSHYQHAEIPLAALLSASNHTRTYGLEISVNGTPVKLMLDTGATGFVIQRQTAEKAGVVRLSDAKFRGIGSNTRTPGGYRALAEHVHIGSVNFRDALIGVTDHYFEDGSDGLVGTDVFAEFLVTVDFGGRRLRLDPLPGYQPGSDEPEDGVVRPEMKNYTRFFRFGHMLLIPTRLNDSREALFLIDSGSARTLISYDFAAEVTKVSRDDLLRLSGMSGQVSDVYKTGDLFLQFAGFRQKNLGITVFDTRSQSHHLGVEISGFLGLPVLNLFTLTIDYRDGLVNFEYREK
jgi:hypothetical protein